MKLSNSYVVFEICLENYLKRLLRRLFEICATMCTPLYTHETSKDWLDETCKQNELIGEEEIGKSGYLLIRASSN